MLSRHVALGGSLGEAEFPSAPLGVEDLDQFVPVVIMLAESNELMVLPPPETISGRIHIVRGVKVMFDFDIAGLYGVPTKALNQGVKRNRERFPEDFMFQLSTEEFEDWRSQIVTSNVSTKMGLRRPPYAFTEHGVAMLASVLKSEQAIQMSIRIVRAFIQHRETLAAQDDLARRVDWLEWVQQDQASVLSILAEEIEGLKIPVENPLRRAFGFGGA